jgi:hypothetical protein
MQKGYLRPAGAPIAGAIVALCLFITPAILFPQKSRVWWDVRVSLTVEGTYTVRDIGTTYSGDFTYSVQWDGSMERDGNDFLLYHTATKDLIWKIREDVSPPQEQCFVTEKDAEAKPFFELSYILREGEFLEVAFKVKGFSVPLASSRGMFELFLPRSGEHVENRSSVPYKNFISKGTNHISIKEKGLEKKPQENSFAWEWKRRGWILLENRTVMMAHHHKAEVIVSLVPHRQ